MVNWVKDGISSSIVGQTYNILGRIRDQNKKRNLELTAKLIQFSPVWFTFLEDTSLKEKSDLHIHECHVKSSPDLVT